MTGFLGSNLERLKKWRFFQKDLPSKWQGSEGLWKAMTMDALKCMQSVKVQHNDIIQNIKPDNMTCCGKMGG